MSLVYDTVTLQMQTLRWQNLSDRPAAVEITTSAPLPVIDSAQTIAAGTALTDRDISGLGLQMQTFVVNGQTKVGVPTDIRIVCRFPG